MIEQIPSVDDPTLGDLGSALAAVVGTENVDVGEQINEDDTHDECLTVAGVRPAAVVRPATTAEVAAIVRSRASDGVAAHRTRLGHRAVRSLHPGRGRRRRVVRADGDDPRDRPREPRRRRPTGRDPAPARRGAAAARSRLSGVPRRELGVARRQRRHERRRDARGEVRRDPPPGARPHRRARHRRGAAHRRQVRQGDDGLRPDTADHRVRGHAGARDRGRPPAVSPPGARGHAAGAVHHARRDRRRRAPHRRQRHRPADRRVHRSHRHGRHREGRRPRPRRSSRRSGTGPRLPRRGPRAASRRPARRGRRGARHAHQRPRRARRLRAARPCRRAADRGAGSGRSGRPRPPAPTTSSTWSCPGPASRRTWQRSPTPVPPPGSVIVACGHAGDGNVHLSVYQPDDEVRHELLHALFAARQRARRCDLRRARHRTGQDAVVRGAGGPDQGRPAAADQGVLRPAGILNPGAIFSATA